MRALFLLVLTLLAAACATGESYQATSERFVPVPAGQGRVFFYRPSVVASALQPAIRMNDTVVGKSTSKGFLFVDRPPGEYTIVTSTLLDHYLSVTLAAGETKYVKLKSSVGVYAGHIIPQLADSGTAQRDIAKMKYIGKPEMLAQ